MQMSLYYQFPFLLRQHSEWCQVAKSFIDDVNCHAQGFGNGLDGFERHGVLARLDPTNVRPL